MMAARLPRAFYLVVLCFFVVILTWHFIGLSTSESLYLDYPAVLGIDESSLKNYSILLSAAYYHESSVNELPPEAIDFAQFDTIFFAFASLNNDSTISWSEDGQSKLSRLVNSAKTSGFGTKIVLSIGGADRSYWFSSTMSTDENRKTFVQACVNAVEAYDLEGIDIAWEFPTIGTIPSMSEDTNNLLRFFRSLRSALGREKIISAMVSEQPWVGSKGLPLTDVTAFAAQISYLNIMNDMPGPTSIPNPNMSLGNDTYACDNTSEGTSAISGAIVAWTKAGFPASKLILGLPLYGYASSSVFTALVDSPSSVGSHVNRRYKLDVPGHGRFLEGHISFKNLLASGALEKKNNLTYVASKSNGYLQGWDDCSGAPFIYNDGRQTMVTYDDPISLSQKALFARRSGLAGCVTWSLDLDDGTALQRAIRYSLTCRYASSTN